MASRIERLERLDELRRMGALTDAEYNAQKGRLIGPHPTSGPSISGVNMQTPVENREPEHDRLAEAEVLAQPVRSGSEHHQNRSDEHLASMNNQPVDDGFVGQPDQPAAEAYTTTATPTRKVDRIDRFIDGFPSWGSMSDLAKFAIFVVGVIALWLIWLALKYLGVVIGLALLLYSVKEMRASKAAALDVEGRARKKADIRTGNFKVLAGFAVALIATATAIDYYSYAYDPLRMSNTVIASERNNLAKCVAAVEPMRDVFSREGSQLQELESNLHRSEGDDPEMWREYGKQYSEETKNVTDQYGPSIKTATIDAVQECDPIRRRIEDKVNTLAQDASNIEQFTACSNMITGVHSMNLFLSEPLKNVGSMVAWPDLEKDFTMCRGWVSAPDS